jgi:hypothetical protein
VQDGVGSVVSARCQMSGISIGSIYRARRRDQQNSSGVDQTGGYLQNSFADSSVSNFDIRRFAEQKLMFPMLFLGWFLWDSEGPQTAVSLLNKT